jgi:hypothetical protein
LQNTGWKLPALLACGVFLLCALFQFAVLLPLREQAQQARERAAHGQERARLQRTMQEQLAREEDPARQLELFYGFFDTGQRLPDVLARLHNAAAAQGIALEQGEYRLFKDNGGKLLRYQITLPVQGPYTNIRRFVAGALRELPVAALDQVSFERGKIGDSRIDAQVRLTLYMIDDER